MPKNQLDFNLGSKFNARPLGQSLYNHIWLGFVLLTERSLALQDMTSLPTIKDCSIFNNDGPGIYLGITNQANVNTLNRY